MRNPLEVTIWNGGLATVQLSTTACFCEREPIVVRPLPEIRRMVLPAWIAAGAGADDEADVEVDEPAPDGAPPPHPPAIAPAIMIEIMRPRPRVSIVPLVN